MDHGDDGDLTTAQRRVCRIVNKRGWIVTGCVFVLNVCIIGIIHSVSVILVELQNEFNTTSTAIGWVGSISTATVCSMSPLSCFLYELTSHRTVAIIGVVLSAAGIVLTSFATNLPTTIVTFGIIFGIGGNFVYNPLMNLLIRYFPRKRCTQATSMAVSGTAIGMLSLGPLFNICFSAYGWRTTFRGFGITILVIGLVCCVPFNPPPLQTRIAYSSDAKIEIQGYDELENKFMKYFRILKLVEHWLFNFAIIFSTCAALFNLIYLVSMAESKGIPSDKASNMIAISAGGQLCGRALCVTIGDKLPFSRVIAMFITCLLGTAITTSLIFMDTYTMFIIYVVVSGIPMGIHWSLIYSVAVEIFGVSRNSEAVGYLTMSIGLAALAAPHAFGKGYDVTGSYDISIVICSAFWFLSAVCYMSIVMYIRWHPDTVIIYATVPTDERPITEIISEKISTV